MSASRASQLPVPIEMRERANEALACAGAKVAISAVEVSQNNNLVVIARAPATGADLLKYGDCIAQAILQDGEAACTAHTDEQWYKVQINGVDVNP